MIDTEKIKILAVGATGLAADAGVDIVFDELSEVSQHIPETGDTKIDLILKIVIALATLLKFFLPNKKIK